MSHGCKVGRVLRKLDWEEVTRRDDEWFGYRPYRPLTPEEAEDWRREYERRAM